MTNKLKLSGRFADRRKIDRCPCGEHNNKDGKFHPFEGFTKFGKCYSCDRWFYPEAENDYSAATPKPAPPPYLIPFAQVKASLKGYNQNKFVLWLQVAIGKEGAARALKTYFIGTSKKYKGATIFWTIDKNHNVRRGSIMVYDENGHRVKDKNHSVHALLKKSDLKPAECFFGEHLINHSAKPIAIVESAKTAVICNHFMPQFIWLSCNGASGLNRQKMQALEGREVVLYPDAGKFEQWQTDAHLFSDIARIRVSRYLEENANVIEFKNGIDLADVLLKEAAPPF